MRDASMGVNVNAAAIETVMTIVTLIPNCLNIIPLKPEIIVNGRNTAIIVSVDATTESATSFVPYIAASRGELPRSRCVVIFSSTTIASSTTIPIAMERELNDIMLREFPEKLRYINAAMSDTGMVSTMMNVARQRPRKKSTTSTTKSAA